MDIARCLTNTVYALDPQSHFITRLCHNFSLQEERKKRKIEDEAKRKAEKERRRKEAEARAGPKTPNFTIVKKEKSGGQDDDEVKTSNHKGYNLGRF